MLSLPPTPLFATNVHAGYQAPQLANTLVVYRISVADFTEREAALTALLTPAEQQHAARYTRLADQLRFRVGRACLRYLLGQRLGQPPATIALRVGSYGKPQLAEPASVHFNVAHSGDWVVVALAAREVGIDLEQLVADFDFSDVAAQRFSDPERRLLSLSHEPHITFYHIWTQLEARAKASGVGLGDAELRPAASGYPAAQWTVQNFGLIPGHPGALAYPADWQPVIQFRSLDARLIG
ncbi:4'-phosphopantetheinyl transferase superfamily protein [Hymenobacter sp. UV11]|uniref:4'-phosphopantetheinyl transferase family protein n=1 Tax=Hymenobacter sp. UV11 TaxID=1849735 RepID=UPI00105BC95B|nr:4'-phosphopantetheinyl transferase superfamily protein [Hymenobacter sp. UV11]TFZ68502.1 4'-phosphopantetheinyl transferase superfamily protein [Hymenobacter sp. UV11]